ncbi:MAG: NYN domain-containing protein [Deltaproteobacteria bacterium]|nr:NYN domain-containing protein [Deltaproteobacteria bacterium]
MPFARRTLIDGYNVIRTNPSGSHLEQTKGGEAARQWLIDHCLRALRPGEQWTVVFDGDGIGSSRDAGGAELTVRFAAPQTADEMIRDLGFHAAALGASCLIVSSDNDVRIEGCDFQDSSSFYDYLLRHAGRQTAQPADDGGRIIDKLLAYLAECGHIKSGDCIPAATRDALRVFFRYFGDENHKPQKIAREVESLLRDGVRLAPDPDTEKAVFRNIKSFFEKK